MKGAPRYKKILQTLRLALLYRKFTREIVDMIKCALHQPSITIITYLALTILSLQQL